MTGIYDRLVWTDNRVNVLEEDDPGHHGMREPGFLSFLVMLAKVAGSVKELLGNDRRAQLYFILRVNKLLAGRAGGVLAQVGKRIFERHARAIQTFIAALEELAHVRWH